MPSAVCEGGPNDRQIIHQHKDCSERSWLYAWIWDNCLCTMLLLVYHLEAFMYPHHLLADAQWILGAKPNLQQSVLFHILNFRLFQRCSHCHQWRKISQNVTKIHPIYDFIYFYESCHGINSGCAWLAQNGSILNTTHCTFTSNNAEIRGGAIFAGVGHGIQGVPVLENRIHFWVVTQFCTKSPWNFCCLSNGPSPHSFSIPTFGLK